MIHGILHLCGYNDKTQVKKTVMSEKEDLLFKSFHVNVSRETFHVEHLSPFLFGIFAKCFQNMML